MGQTKTLGKTATSLRTAGEGTHVRYHKTDVVSFNTSVIVLRHGGWLTATTKLRMNQASCQFDLGYSVHQRKKQWYVSRWNAEKHEWYDETPFSPTGVHLIVR